MDDCLERTQSMVAMTKLKTSEEEEDGQQVHEPNDSTTVLAAGQETKQEENNGGGGFIDQLVSNLPSVSAPLSIPDDPAPDPEEASLLIHIVQD